ncbi:hypothetical protein LH486_27680, partial [Klebsiella pneumoniae]|nr:hypothetical protein [Klebsiella pneumoniae]
MSERRYSPLATLFAATFLFRIGNAVAALALPWFVLSHTKSAAWAGATAGYRKYKPPFCSSSEVSYLKFPHSFTAQAPILTA